MIDKGKYDLTTVIGVSISVIAFILILIFKPGMPKNVKNQEPRQSENAKEVQAVVQAETLAQNPAAEAEGAKEPAAAAHESGAPRNVAQPFPKSNGTPLRMGEGDFELDVSSDGAGIVAVNLNKYLLNAPRQTENNGPVVLSDGDYPLLALSLPGVLLSSGDGAKLSANEVELVRKSADGRLRVTEKWALVPERTYEIAYTATIENLTGESVSLQGITLEGSAIPTSVTPDRKASRGESSGGVSISQNGKVRDFSLKALTKLKAEERDGMSSSATSWAAVHSKYFVMAFWMNEGDFAGVEVAAVPSAGRDGAEPKPESRYHARAILPVAEMEAGKSFTYSVTAYAGPKMFERLYDYRRGLESVMEMDRFFFWRPFWMRQISRWLLKMLVWISEMFPPSIGYGMAVIILTVLVKGIFWPLSHKSTASMRRMQALKPELDALRAKYKDDPSTMYRKQQELFKKNNVSQLGGCLPMLLQIPVFFALFNTFRNAIEMRHASFLWAYDLSVPDTLSFSPEAVPIRPLALIMGLTMYFQQKMTPNPDPQQAKMMNFMSIFFIVLFYNMPSALTLYLSVSYILGIAQTALTNKLMPPIATTQEKQAAK